MVSVKDSLKLTLLQLKDTCFYCNLKLGVNPIEEGQPYYRKLRSYARMIIVQLNTADSVDYNVPENFALAHYWCYNKAKPLSIEGKAEFIQQVRRVCSDTGTLPWVDKKFLYRYLQQGGNLMLLLNKEMS